MKIKVLLTACLCLIIAHAGSLDFLHTSDHSFVTPMQDPDDFCYPPEGQAFSNYFANDRCYYRFNNNCSYAQVVRFDPQANPDQTANKNFFSLCSIPNNREKLGPQMLLYVEPGATHDNFSVNACVILPNQSATQLSEAKLTVFCDSCVPPAGTPDPAIHVPGCGPNQIAILNAQYPNPVTPPTYQVICQDITNQNETVQTAVINNLNSLLNGKYTQCQTV